MQEAEVYLPIVSQKYTIDLSRTRSHFLPGYPLDVVVSVKPTEVHMSGAGWTKMCCTLFWQAILRFSDGSAAAGVPVNIKVSTSEKSWQGPTDQQGAVSTVFNIPSVSHITVEVSGELDGTAPFPPSKPF